MTTSIRFHENDQNRFNVSVNHFKQSGDFYTIKVTNGDGCLGIFFKNKERLHQFVTDIMQGSLTPREV